MNGGIIVNPSLAGSSRSAVLWHRPRGSHMRPVCCLAEVPVPRGVRVQEGQRTPVGDSERVDLEVLLLRPQAPLLARAEMPWGSESRGPQSVLIHAVSRCSVPAPRVQQ